MKFLIDNSISPAVADGLRKAGHDAMHLLDYEISAASDDVVMDRAIAEERIIVTYDLDFPRILSLRRQSKPSLIVFRRLRHPLRQVPAIVDNLHRLRIVLDDGCIAMIEPDRIRVRDLPLDRRVARDDS